MNRRITFMLAGVMIAASPALADDVTPERLINADREPQNWLMNHRTYDSQRYSPLDKINKSNVKSLRLAYAVAIGGTSANENSAPRLNASCYEASCPGLAVQMFRGRSVV
jgi:glucose dehydrogenase